MLDLRVPDRKYIEMSLKFGLFERSAHLRDYEFHPGTGVRTVLETKQTGEPIRRNESVRIIYPLVESEDGQWVQAMGRDGTCGYIRRSRIDENELREKAQNAKKLPRYRIALSEKRQNLEKEFENSYKGFYGFCKEIDDSFKEKEQSKDSVIIETSIGKQSALSYSLNSLYYEAAASQDPQISQRILQNSLNERYDQDVAYYGNRFYAEEVCRNRVLFKNRARKELEVSSEDVKSGDDNSGRMMIVAENNHGSDRLRTWMAAQINPGQNESSRKDNADSGKGNADFSNIGRIYIEDFMEEDDQEALDQYLLSGQNVPMPGILERFCKVESHKGFAELLRAVKAYNIAQFDPPDAVNQQDQNKNLIRVVAIGSGLAQTDTAAPDPKIRIERAAKFNQRATEIIEKNPPAEGKKGLIYCGTAHALLHPAENGMWIKGFCQIFNEDAFGMDENGKIQQYQKDYIKDINDSNSWYKSISLQSAADDPEKEMQALLNKKIQELSLQWTETNDAQQKKQLESQLEEISARPVETGKRLLNERKEESRTQLSDRQDQMKKDAAIEKLKERGAAIRTRENSAEGAERNGSVTAMTFTELSQETEMKPAQRRRADRFGEKTVGERRPDLSQPMKK